MNQGENISTALETYRLRLIGYQNHLDRLRRSANRLSRARLVTAIIVVTALLLFFNLEMMSAALITIIVGIPTFGILVVWYARIASELIRTRRMAEINRRAIARIDGRWQEFSDNGLEFADNLHPYVNDLDIFGRGSLFQWLNTTGTYMGRKKLSLALSSQAFDNATALARREAIAELANLLDWRQCLIAKALETDAFRKDPSRIIEWMQNGTSAGAVNPMKYFWPLFTLAYPIIALLFYWITANYHLFTWWIPLNLIVLLYHHKKATNILSHFDDCEQTLSIYSDLLRHIEQPSFQSDALRDYQQKLGVNVNRPASAAIAGLRTLTAIGQVRYNFMLAVFLNLFLLWDLQAALLLNRWKEKYGRYIAAWFDVIGEIEMLSSLATLPFDNPDWCYPHLDDPYGFLKAEEMGHPLIEKNSRIGNAISVESNGSVLIITGSNMSGKTTLLRTIGVNLVLAFSGAPVCAKSFWCSPHQLLTSMRITDDLQGGISTFYAELLRIRSIIDSARNRPSVILIDEIFRGTNTHDRHVAAKYVLKHLCTLQTITVISTHDLDLADLEEDDPQKFRNFHFEDYYQDLAVHFDYRLRPGRATASNAIKLLEIIGIMPSKNQ